MLHLTIRSLGHSADSTSIVARPCAPMLAIASPIERKRKVEPLTGTARRRRHSPNVLTVKLPLCQVRRLHLTDHGPAVLRWIAH